MYALNLDTDGRILSATYPEYAPKDATIVESLPEGNLYEYRYEQGNFVHEPLPEPEQPETQPSDAERITELEEALALLLSGVTE